MHLFKFINFVYVRLPRPFVKKGRAMHVGRCPCRTANPQSQSLPIRRRVRHGLQIPYRRIRDFICSTGNSWWYYYCNWTVILLLLIVVLQLVPPFTIERVSYSTQHPSPVGEFPILFGLLLQGVSLSAHPGLERSEWTRTKQPSAWKCGQWRRWAVSEVCSSGAIVPSEITI